MSDLYNKIIGERGTAENILSKIPGFRGYMEMSARREADRMIREHVAGRYESLIDILSAHERNILGLAGGLGHMEKTKAIKTKIEVLRRRVSTDAPGYSGFFASNKIGPDELAKVYSFDESMLTYADSIGLKLDALGAEILEGGENLAKVLAELETTISEAGQAYDLRDDLLNGLG